MSFNFGGFGDKIQGLMDTVKEGGVGELLQKLPLDQLLSGTFLQKFTPFESLTESLTEWLQSGGFSASSAEDLKSLPQEQLNEHVSNTTSFESLKEMLVKAAEYYAQRK